jgi:hypothetical protein
MVKVLCVSLSGDFIPPIKSWSLARHLILALRRLRRGGGRVRGQLVPHSETLSQKLVESSP